MLIAKLLPKKILSQQARKPSGLIGRFLMTRLFLKGNFDLNRWVKACLEIEGDERILEIGYGPGQLMHSMADSMSSGSLVGLDFSQTMYEQASRLNRQYIDAGKVSLQLGNCHSLPFNAESFDKVCTANTLYFWSDPVQNLQQIYHVIKPGGLLVLGFRDDKQMNGLKLSREIFSVYSQQQVSELLSLVGFSQVRIEQHADTPLISYCAIGKKESKAEKK